MPPIYHRRPRVILLKYEIRIAVLHLPGCTSASNRAMKVTGSGREQLCNPRGASSSRRPDHNSSRSATWPLIFVSFRHSLRNPETGRLEGVSHPRGSRSPRVLTPEASRVRPTVPDLMVRDSKNRAGPGDRTYKLASGTTSEPGRYVESLGEPRRGRLRETGVHPPEIVIDPKMLFEALAPSCTPSRNGLGDLIVVTEN